MPSRELTSAELVETFEREAGEPWFRTVNGQRVYHVSPPYPGIVPTWPWLIRDRAIEETTPNAEALAAAVSGFVSDLTGEHFKTDADEVRRFLLPRLTRSED